MANADLLDLQRRIIAKVIASGYEFYGDVWADIDIRIGGGLQVGGVATDPPISTINTSYQFTLTGAISDEYYCGLQESPSFTGAFTIARHNYMYLNNPVLAGGAAVTDACIIRFNAAAGTHKATLAGTTHPHPQTTDAWIKINMNGTVFYMPAYSHTT